MILLSHDFPGRFPLFLKVARPSHPRFSVLGFPPPVVRCIFPFFFPSLNSPFFNHAPLLWYDSLSLFCSSQTHQSCSAPGRRLNRVVVFGPPFFFRSKGQSLEEFSLSTSFSFLFHPIPSWTMFFPRIHVFVPFHSPALGFGIVFSPRFPPTFFETDRNISNYPVIWDFFFFPGFPFLTTPPKKTSVCFNHDNNELTLLPHPPVFPLHRSWFFFRYS